LIQPFKTINIPRMHTKPLFATIDLPDNRKIIIRRMMPPQPLKHLHEQSQRPGFSGATIGEYEEYDVSITIPIDYFRKFMICLS
jgi:hypothetical protein